MKKAELKTIIFYSKKFKETINFASNIADLLKNENFHVDIVDISSDDDEWKRLDLRSVPSIVIYKNGTPISNIVSYASFESIISRLNAVTSHNEDIHTSNSLTEIPYFVVCSSGTHRYTRWHEDSLTNLFPGKATGWCAPNSPEEGNFLILCIPSQGAIKEVHLYPRQRNDGTQSYKSFPKGIAILAGYGKDAPLLKVCEDILFPEIDEPFKIILDASISTNHITIKIISAHNIDGKFFPAFNRIKLMGVVERNNNSLVIHKPGEFRKSFSSTHIVKHGIHAIENAQIEQFNLFAGQGLPSSCAKTARVIYVVSGSLVASYDEKPIRMASLDSLLVEAGHIFGAKAEVESIFLAFHISVDLSMIWESRGG